MNGSPEQPYKQEKPQWREIEPYDLLYDGIDLQAEIGSKGVRLIIPSIFLHGRQDAREYSNKKRRQVEAALEKNGINFLLEHPVIVCAVPIHAQTRDFVHINQLLLAIIDGHHRARYSGNFGIIDIPSLVCTPSTIVRVINNHKTEAEQIFVPAFKARLKSEVSYATASFGASFPEARHPKMIPFPNIRTLKQKVVSF